MKQGNKVKEIKQSFSKNYCENPEFILDCLLQVECRNNFLIENFKESFNGFIINMQEMDGERDIKPGQKILVITFFGYPNVIQCKEPL